MTFIQQRPWILSTKSYSKTFGYFFKSVLNSFSIWNLCHVFNKTKSLQLDLSNVNTRLNSLLTDLNDNSKNLNKFKKQEQKKQPNRNSLWDISFNMITKTYAQKETSSKEHNLPERIFIKRHSLLTQMFKVKL
jgi:hypothetical protein